MTQWSIQAPASWWSPVMKAVGLCSEPGKGSTDSLSFMSCVLIDIKDGNAHIISQSMSSALDINVGDYGEVEGQGRVLLPVKDFTHAISSLSHSDMITVSQEDDNEESVEIDTDDGAVHFSVAQEDIIDDDMLPQPPVIEDDDVFTDVDSSQLTHVYKQGSIMSKANIGSEELGFDPLSGSIINIDDKGVQVLSLSISSSEAFVSVEKGHKDYVANCVSSPQATTARLDTFASYCSEGKISIASTGCIVLSGNGMVMSISPLNTGSIKNTTVTYENIVDTLSPAWENRIVTATAPSREFFQALSRAGSVSDEAVKMFIDDTTITVCGVDSRREDYPFTQEISCSTQWHSDMSHDISYSIDYTVMKKVGTFVSKHDEVVFSVAFDETGTTPWAMVMYDGNFDVDNPHDFFLIAITK